VSLFAFVKDAGVKLAGESVVWKKRWSHNGSRCQGRFGNRIFRSAWR
jgi:hypothetical protein